MLYFFLSYCLVWLSLIALQQREGSLHMQFLEKFISIDKCAASDVSLLFGQIFIDIGVNGVLTPL